MNLILGPATRVRYIQRYAITEYIIMRIYCIGVYCLLAFIFRAFVRPVPLSACLHAKFYTFLCSFIHHFGYINPFFIFSFN